MLSVVHNLHLKIYVIHSSVGIGIFLYLHTIPWIMEQSFIIFMKDNITVKLEFMAVSWPATTRNSSLLLMVSQALKFDSSFEGILGLGVPNLTVNTGPHGGTHRQKRQKTDGMLFFHDVFVIFDFFFTFVFFWGALLSTFLHLCWWGGSPILDSWGVKNWSNNPRISGGPAPVWLPWITLDYRGFQASDADEFSGGSKGKTFLFVLQLWCRWSLDSSYDWVDDDSGANSQRRADRLW